MDLTDEQKAKISEWVADGATLNEVQERLKEELEITITYLETRFLIADLGLELQEDKEKETEKAEELVTEQAGEGMEEPVLGAADDAPPGTGGVSVTVDAITQPGTMVSGRVTFSDGQTAAWYLDQLGRLGLNPDQEDYRPSEEDIMAFQRELQKAVQ